ncbi:3-oxoacid CoA-transferase subunit A [Alginatibacterium sediminis]|uniref:3-oxoacid CoA-transferase subunit A n=1 Tax=Alginatibacterium sediminis TaxID=2164068 RepID=A0A420EHS1_9ALTE|nr:3-oxoacid CoA-transferase subunit A [Alginatibacterium sediminis]RKF20245.1 3-oxoacid CoA-transferase subunit A [Alginatibacterium sediminis]
MKGILDKQQVADLFIDQHSVMVGGFMANGAPELLIDILLDSKLRDLHLISTDTAMPDKGSGRLITAKRIKRLTASHIGLNPNTGKQMFAEELDVELVPQGSLAERIRCGGAGLGGVLTPTGLGTLAAENKRVIEVEGQQFLLELPLRADIALIKASKADERGNLFYAKTTRNFNPLMATAATLVIAQVDEIVAKGQLEAESIATPGIFVDYLYCPAHQNQKE